MLVPNGSLQMKTGDCGRYKSSYFCLHFLLAFLLSSSLSLFLLPLSIVSQDNGSPRLESGFEILEPSPGVERVEKMVKVESHLNIWELVRVFLWVCQYQTSFCIIRDEPHWRSNQSRDHLERLRFNVNLFRCILTQCSQTTQCTCWWSSWSSLTARTRTRGSGRFTRKLLTCCIDTSEISGAWPTMIPKWNESWNVSTICQRSYHC